MICYGHFLNNEIVSVEKYNFYPEITVTDKYKMITDYRYSQFIDSLPDPEPEPDYKQEYSKLKNDNEKMNYIAKRMELI